MAAWAKCTSSFLTHIECEWALRLKYQHLVVHPKGASRRCPKLRKVEPFKKSSSRPIQKSRKRAEITIEGADQLYREIRIDNTLEDEMGKKVKLREGSHVNVTVEANPRF